MTAPTRVSTAMVAGYGVGGVAGGISAMVPSVLLLYFMTQVLALPVGLASLVILLPKAVIIVFDPVIGRRSDQSQSRWGRRAPFMAAGALIASAGFALLFGVPRLASDGATFAAVLLAYLAAAMGWSVFSVPWTALPAELTGAADARARLLGARMMFMFAGMIIGAAGAPVLVAQFGGGSHGYAAMALTIMPVLVLTMGLSAATALSAARQRPVPSAPPAMAMRAALPVIARFAPFGVALLLNVMAVVGMSAFMAGAPYFIVQGLGRSEVDVAALLVAQLMASFITMPGWARAVPRLGLRVTLVAALAIGIIGAALVVLGSGGWPLVLAGSALFGASVGGIQIAGLAGLTEAIERFARATGTAQGGTMTGLWTASERIGYALGPALVAALIGANGFRSGTTRALQSPEALAACRTVMFYGAAPMFALAMLVALLAPAYRALAAQPRAAAVS